MAIVGEVHRDKRKKQRRISLDSAETRRWPERTVYFSSGRMANGCYGPRKRRERSRRADGTGYLGLEEICGTMFGS